MSRLVDAAFRFEQGLGQMRVVHSSVQGNHMHLVVEAGDQRVLGRRIQGMSVRLARSINRLMGRLRGRVFAERYHGHVLRTPREVRNAIRYVRFNHAKHHGLSGSSPDRYASDAWFGGWTQQPTSWLLRVGWQRAGPL